MFAPGWSARLDPRRAIPVIGGHFPGVSDDIPGPEVSNHVGPAAGLTIGRRDKHRVILFLRASAVAEADVVGCPGLLWATGLTNLPARAVDMRFATANPLLAGLTSVT